MGHRGSGRYAKGDKALGICERCSKKMLRRKMVYDGQFPDLLVCTECWDPKHPQEYLPPAFDPVTIYDPTGDPDKEQANVQALGLPITDSGLNEIPFSLPLQIGVEVNSSKFNFLGGGGAAGETPGAVLVGDAGGNVINGTASTTRPPLPGAGADPDSMGSVTAGDLMIIVAIYRDPIQTNRNTIDSGWHTLFDANQESDGGNITVFWKIATVSETAPTITWASTTPDQTRAQTFAYSNVDQNLPFGDFSYIHEQSMSSITVVIEQLEWFTGKLPVQFGDKVVTIFASPDAETFTSWAQSEAPTTQLMQEVGSAPYVSVDHWDSSENTEKANLLDVRDGITSNGPVEGMTLSPVGMTLITHTVGGNRAMKMDYNATAESTYFEKTVSVVAGKHYWIGSYTGVHQSSIEPDWMAMSMNDGTETGIFYQSCDRNGFQHPLFGNDIGPGAANKKTFYMGARGTVTIFRWTATNTGLATFRWYATDSSTSLIHSTDMSGDTRGIPMGTLWICEAQDDLPLQPQWPGLNSKTGRNYIFNPVHYAATARNAAGVSNHVQMLAFTIRGADNSPNPHRFEQWPGVMNTGNFTTNDNTYSTANGTVLSIEGQDKVYGSPPRRGNSGKYYYEIKIAAGPFGANFGVSALSAGVGPTGMSWDDHVGQGAIALDTGSGAGVELDGLNAYVHSTSHVVSYTAVTDGDVIAFAIDFDSDKCEYYVNNVLQADIMALGPDTFEDELSYIPALRVGLPSSNRSAEMTGRLKSSEFTYTPPTGYLPWSPE